MNKPRTIIHKIGSDQQIGPPLSRRDPMFAAEIAQRLGIVLTTFYRNRQHYHLVDKMPRPINTTGRPAYDRAGMEAWLTRNDPRRPPAAANDTLPPPLLGGDAEWNDFLRRHYTPAE